MSKVAVYNPNQIPEDDLPFIYGFNNGGAPGFFEGCLMSADGVYLGGHICSSEGFMPGDLGILDGWRPDRHEAFRKHYPQGYRMAFVPHKSVKNTPGLLAALEANKNLPLPQDEGA